MLKVKKETRQACELINRVNSLSLRDVVSGLVRFEKYLLSLTWQPHRGCLVCLHAGHRIGKQEPEREVSLTATQP